MERRKEVKRNEILNHYNSNVSQSTKQDMLMRIIMCLKLYIKSTMFSLSVTVTCKGINFVFYRIKYNTR